MGESEMKGHVPMMEESTDSTASGTVREKQLFDIYVKSEHKSKPHYGQPENEPEPPKEYKPEPPKPESEAESPVENTPEPPKPESEPEPPKEYEMHCDHKNVVLIDGALNKVDLNSGVRIALSGKPEDKPEAPKEYKPEPPKHGYKPIEEDMDSYVEDDNSYEIIPEHHEPLKVEGKKSGTVHFKTSFKANKVVVHPLVLEIAQRIMEAKKGLLGHFYNPDHYDDHHDHYELVHVPHYEQEPHYGNHGYEYEPEVY